MDLGQDSPKSCSDAFKIPFSAPWCDWRLYFGLRHYRDPVPLYPACPAINKIPMKENKYVVAVLWVEEKGVWVLVILLKWNSKSISECLSKGKFDFFKKNLIILNVCQDFSHLDLEILKGSTAQLKVQVCICHESHSLLATECFSRVFLNNWNNAWAWFCVQRVIQHLWI